MRVYVTVISKYVIYTRRIKKFLKRNWELTITLTETLEITEKNKEIPKKELRVNRFEKLKQLTANYNNEE